MTDRNHPNLIITSISPLLSERLSLRIRSRGIFVLISMALIILTSGCNSNTPPLFQLASPQPEISPSSPDLNPIAAITFDVEVPQDTPLDQAVLFSILDEVTGLALNIDRREMQKSGERTYSITLPFPVGALIKYRYARQDYFLAEEHTANGVSVRYRIYRVDGPGVVNDVITAWSDLPYSGPTGRIMGQAIDAQTGTPIPNMLVTAGGVHSITTTDGNYLLEGLPPGTQNLVLYAPDGTYRTFQQGARVAADSTTPASIQMNASNLVHMVFTISVPPDTLPAVPIRMAGNLYQLGNTFANLSGGINTLASRMPTLNPLADGRYFLEIDLPAGAFLEYKYTLGDGFWNAEHTPNGDFRLRTLTIPKVDTVIEDQIDNWGESPNVGPILFDLVVPPSTPEYDFVSIQFNPFGWTEPLPMWDLGNDHWVYILFSPLTNRENFVYRYCRNDQCSRADDIATQGFDTPGRQLSIIGGMQTIKDNVDEWRWLPPASFPELPGNQEIHPRSEGFTAGVELPSYFHPSWTPRFPVTCREIETLNANWVFLSPSWTYTLQTPPILEPVQGRDISWSDMQFSTQKAHSFGLNIAMYPSPDFRDEMESWWLSTPRDFAWWQVWFERYQNFILYFADMAESNEAEGLVLGGEWVTPALPGGKLPDGTNSEVPIDAEDRWRSIISAVRNRYKGTLFWALPATSKGMDPPPFIEALDQVYLLWSLPLSDQPDATIQQMSQEASQYLDTKVFPYKITLEMPIIIGVAYASAKGSLQGCIRVHQSDSADDKTDCLNPAYLETPYPDNHNVAISLEEQLQAYQSLLMAVNDQEWIDGFVTRGYYPPGALQDKSISIHGKPSQELVAEWYSQFLVRTNTSE
jgi:hypothetical protein